MFLLLLALKLMEDICSASLLTFSEVKEGITSDAIKGLGNSSSVPVTAIDGENPCSVGMLRRPSKMNCRASNQFYLRAMIAIFFFVSVDLTFLAR